MTWSDPYGLTPLDWVALAYFLIMWLAYAPFVQWRGRRVQMLNSAMIDHRRAWMEAQLGREVKVADTVIVGHIMSTAGFFASTTVIVIAALLGVLFNLGLATRPDAGGVWSIATPTPLEIKLILILVVAAYAFQSFTWSIRQANFAAVLMGAAPPPSMDEAFLQRIAISMGNIITGTAQSYDNGMRAYYFALGAVTWVVSPIVFMIATTGVVALLLHRQTRSRTALALREIAIARSEACVLNKETAA